jgi:hypothetical protein
MKRYFMKLLFTGLIFFAAATSSIAQPTAVNTKSKTPLQNLQAVKLAIEVTSREASQGVTEASLRQVIETRLNKTGIQVLPPGQEGKLIGNPTILVKLLLFKTGEREFTWLTDVQFREDVRSERHPSITEQAATWQNSAMGLFSGYPTAAEKVHEGVGSIIDWFIRDFRSVNPPRTDSSTVLPVVSTNP